MEPASAPAAPEVAPAAPAAPVAPAPEVAPAPVVQPSPEQTAQASEDKEWDDATKELYPQLEKRKESVKDEPAKPAENAETQKEGEPDPASQKPDAGAGEGDDAANKGQDGATKDAEADARAARAAARESAEQVRAVAEDVRTKMFKDTPTQLIDGDGRAIHTIDDVMQLINPRTNEKFTEEQAGTWLLSATQQLNKNIATMEKQVNEIAEVNLAIKDDADHINSKYGDYLKAHPDLQKQLWTEYQKTLVLDPNSEVVTKAPVSLKTFYEMALAPRVEAAVPTAPTAPAVPAEPTAEEKAATAAAVETARRQALADRSDIYRPPADPKSVDPEDKEWDDAIQAEFGDRLPKK